MSLIVKIVLIILSCIVGIVVLFYGILFFWLGTRQSYRVIARNVLISSDWLDIFPHPPLKVKYHVQDVFLAIEGYKYDLGSSLTPIRLKDGTTINPEIQVLDEYGQVYNLEGLTRIGNLIGFHTRFPRDRVYTKVRIRGDKPFRCYKIYWGGSKLK